MGSSSTVRPPAGELASVLIRRKWERRAHHRWHMSHAVVMLRFRSVLGNWRLESEQRRARSVYDYNT